MKNVTSEQKIEIIEADNNLENNDDDLDESEIVIGEELPLVDESELYIFLNNSDERWNEIELIIDEIKEYKNREESNTKINERNEKLYNGLCKMTTVLLVAQLEGYIKGLVNAVIKDLNRNIKFASLPKDIKSKFVSYYIGENKNKYEELVEIFSRVNPEIRAMPFLHEKNKNPSPAIIEDILKNFGVTNFFQLIHLSRVDVVFENNNSEIEELIKDLRSYLKENSKEFPYKIDLNILGINSNANEIKTKNSLWATFLDDLLVKRHNVAHGTIFNNETTDTMLQEYEKKTKVLQYAITIVLINKIISEIK